MTLSAFPYIGGKQQLADWIVGHLPEHKVYVEVFGGAASVLLNKPESRTEVYNDRNGDLVQFFEVARDRPDELEEWLQMVPYSRELHEEWATEFYQEGHRPDDPVERAGRFFFMRYTQFAAKIHTKSGFKSTRETNSASAFSTARDRIQDISDRFGNVIVECLDWKDLVDQYDSPETVMYLDPPYVDTEGYYGAFDFSHNELLATLDDLEGRWLLSYEKVPEALREEEYWVSEREVSWAARANKYEGRKDATERLIMNFDPKEEPSFSGPEQQTLFAETDGGKPRSVGTDTDRTGGDR